MAHRYLSKMAISGPKTGSENGMIYATDSRFELRFVGAKAKKARWKPSSFEIQMVVYPDYKPVTANITQLFRLILAQIISFNWQFSNFLLAIIS